MVSLVVLGHGKRISCGSLRLDWVSLPNDVPYKINSHPFSKPGTPTLTPQSSSVLFWTIQGFTTEDPLEHKINISSESGGERLFEVCID